MNLQAVVEYLQAQNQGKIGVDLFAYFMPADIENGVLVINSTPVSIDPYMGTRGGSLQIIVRGNDVLKIKSKAEALSGLLNQEGLSLGGMSFRDLHPTHEPFIYPRTDGNHLEASVNFSFVYTT